MEGTTLVKTYEKMRAYGLLTIYENAYYSIHFIYGGDLPEKGKEKEFHYDPWLIRVTAKKKDPNAPKLEIAPGADNRMSYSGISINEPVKYQDIEKFEKKLEVRKETLSEIEKVLKQTYPNISIMSN